MNYQEIAAWFHNDNNLLLASLILQEADGLVSWLQVLPTHHQRDLTPAHNHLAREISLEHKSFVLKEKSKKVLRKKSLKFQE